ncbi:MAG: hypothetical protein MJY89_05790 [Bacteroidales bacterium]|nr:hypothetical protein [Bacteroidales bacterium]
MMIGKSKTAGVVDGIKKIKATERQTFQSMLLHNSAQGEINGMRATNGAHSLTEETSD